MATVAAEDADTDRLLFRMLTEGGDERIRPDPASGLNRYLCALRPGRTLAYASSTANDLSAGALDHLRGLEPVTEPALYPVRLDALRDRIRNAYGIGRNVRLVFAPSGTDLEYVALAATPDAGQRPLMNILLGANEIGSGCIHSANGRYFANTTALGVPTRAGIPVAGLAGSQFTMVDIPIRDPLGMPRHAEEILQAIDDSIRIARAAGQHALVHAVHLSKTGLVVPDLATIDRLSERHGWHISWVVDACQARLGAEAIKAYLDRGAIVLLTGSKFIGGPPFSGFALVPARRMNEAAPLPEGLASIFLRGEWPVDWPGADRLPDEANPGLLLRIEAATFELERFRSIERQAVERVIRSFRLAAEQMVERLGASIVPGQQTGKAAAEAEALSLITIDLSALAQDADTGDAQRWWRSLADRGVRLGQPVRYATRPDGRWKPCLRISLSMPMIVERAEQSEHDLDLGFRHDHALIEAALLASITASAVGQE